MVLFLVPISSLEIILPRKRELVVLFELRCGCVCSVSLPRCTVGGLQSEIVPFPGHTNLI